MSISTNILQQDAGTFIANGIKAELEKQIYDELFEYINPKLRLLAEQSATSVVKDALVRIERDLLKGEVNVLVKFGEQP